MKKLHKIVLLIFVMITIVSFILFNLFYKESMLMGAIQETNTSSNSKP
jgi:hypothetical protein